jgi:hypothetical protein
MTAFLMEYRDPRYAGTFLTEAMGDTEQEAIENLLANDIDLLVESYDFEIIRIIPMEAMCRDAKQSI